MKKLLNFLACGFVLLTIALLALPYSKFEYVPISDNYSRPAESYTQKDEATSISTVQAKFVDLSKADVILLTTDVNTLSSNLVIDSITKSNLTNSKPIYLLLDSPGGSVLDGARIISAIQSSRKPVYTVCLQICASMAAMILEYGHERYAVDRSVVMFHPASVAGEVQGELDKVVSRFSFLQRFVNKMDRYTADRSGQTYEAFKAQTTRELWIDAEDALKSHYIDSIIKVDLSTGYDANFGENKAREKLRLSW